MKCDIKKYNVEKDETNDNSRKIEEMKWDWLKQWNRSLVIAITIFI